MIIWSRWGFIAFLAFGASLALGFAVETIVAPDAPPNAGILNICFGMGFLLGATGLWAFNIYALPRLDKPRPQFVHQKLAQPIVNQDGSSVTHQAVPVVNQQTGQQVYTRPSSSLFFIPMRFWPFVIAAVGVGSIVVGFTR